MRTLIALLLATPALAAEPLPTAPPGVAEGCPGPPPRATVRYKGRCLTAKALTKAWRCPEGAKVEAKDNSMFWTRRCVGPEGARVGEEVDWIVTPDSSGRPVRRWLLDAHGDGAFWFYTPDGRVQQHHQVQAGKLHGVQLQFHPNGVLQERFSRRAGKLHGLSTEYRDGAPAVLRCMHEGQMLWKRTDALEQAPTCPPKGFDPADLPDNALKVWLHLPDVGMLKAPWALAAGPAGGLYFTQQHDAATLWHLAEAGAKPTPVANAGYQPRELLLDGGTAYLLGAEHVWAVDLKTKATRKLGDVTGDDYAASLQRHGRSLLWVEPGAEGEGGRVVRLDPGKAPRSLFADAADPRVMRVVGDQVYWGQQNGEIRVGPIAGGRSRKLLDAGGKVFGLLIADGKIIYESRSSSGIEWVPLGGGDAKTLDRHGGRFMLIHGRHFFAVSDMASRAPLDGGDVHVLDNTPNTPRALVLRRPKTGAAEICWTDIVKGSISCIDHRARQRQFGEAL